MKMSDASEIQRRSNMESEPSPYTSYRTLASANIMSTISSKFIIARLDPRERRMIFPPEASVDEIGKQ